MFQTTAMLIKHGAARNALLRRYRTRKHRHVVRYSTVIVLVVDGGGQKTADQSTIPLSMFTHPAMF